MKTRNVLLFLGAWGLGIGHAQAILLDNGDGTVTDTSTGLMWLQDANYAKTSGYDPDGRMTWNKAMAWADALVYAGYDDWRLPIIKDIGNDGCNWSYGGTDCGYNVDTSTSELAYMFHNVLGNESWLTPNGDPNVSGCSFVPPFCVQSTAADGVSILNFQLQPYWSSTEYLSNPSQVWGFMPLTGYQTTGSKNSEVYVWAVRSGGAVNIPEPFTILLIGLGLTGFGLARRNKGRRR
jgi:hypothetical protein